MWFELVKTQGERMSIHGPAPIAWTIRIVSKRRKWETDREKIERRKVIEKGYPLLNHPWAFVCGYDFEGVRKVMRVGVSKNVVQRLQSIRNGGDKWTWVKVSPCMVGMEERRVTRLQNRLLGLGIASLRKKQRSEIKAEERRKEEESRAKISIQSMDDEMLGKWFETAKKMKDLETMTVIMQEQLRRDELGEKLKGLSEEELLAMVEPPSKEESGVE